VLVFVLSDNVEPLGRGDRFATKAQLGADRRGVVFIGVAAITAARNGSAPVCSTRAVGWFMSKIPRAGGRIIYTLLRVGIVAPGVLAVGAR
jgi:hypothetical protein